MTDAQNERTKSRHRVRARRGRSHQHAADDVAMTTPATDAPASPTQGTEAIGWKCPPDIAPPTERYDVYCTHHSASEIEHEPIVARRGMTTLRHLAVDHFGEATLYCDCLHYGPHEWPPTLQKTESAIELDYLVQASSSDT